MDCHGRSWTLIFTQLRSRTVRDAHFSKDAHGRTWTLSGRWVDAGWTLGKIGHATVTVTLPNHENHCTLLKFPIMKKTKLAI